MLWYFYGVIIALVYGPFCPLIEVKNSSWFVDAHCVFVFAPLLQIISIQHEVDVRLKHLRSFIIFNNSLCLNEFSYCGNHVPQTIILPFTCDASAKIILHEGRNHMSPFEPFHLLKQFSHARSIKFEVSKVSTLFMLQIFNALFIIIGCHQFDHWWVYSVARINIFCNEYLFPNLCHLFEAIHKFVLDGVLSFILLLQYQSGSDATKRAVRISNVDRFGGWLS